MNDRELLQMALDAWFRKGGINYHDFMPYMEALRARLAQPEPEPEPVGTQYKYIDAHGKDYWTSEPWEGKKVEAVRYLYTAPPQREWVGLTDAEIMDACSAVWASHPIEVGRVVEAKLKEKNT